MAKVGGRGASASIALAVARVQLASVIGRFTLQTHGAGAVPSSWSLGKPETGLQEIGWEGLWLGEEKAG